MSHEPLSVFGGAVEFDGPSSAVGHGQWARKESRIGMEQKVKGPADKTLWQP
jgi:hypothetical protein